MITTERLKLRAWRKNDIEKYYSINQDEKVLEFLPGAMSLSEVENFIRKQNDNLEKYNYCLWAVQKEEELIGFIGLNYTDFLDKVEIGWRLGSQYWGNGYATEGAKACLCYGLDQLKIENIISFTVPDNKRSINVMEKIALRRAPLLDFKHPKLSSDHRLSNHIVYAKYV